MSKQLYFLRAIYIFGKAQYDKTTRSPISRQEYDTFDRGKFDGTYILRRWIAI